MENSAVYLSGLSTNVNLTDIHGFDYFSRVVKPLLVFPIMCLIIACNVLMLVVVVKSKAYRCVQGVFLTSMAFGNLYIGLVISPSAIIAGVSGEWIFGRAWCVGSAVSLRIMILVTVFHITAITLDKFLKIVYPYKYQQYSDNSTKVSVVVTSVIWVVSSLCAGIPGLLRTRQYRFFEGPMLCLSFSSQYAIIVGMTCIVLTCALNFKLYTIARRHLKEIHRTNSVGGILKKERKSIKMLFLTNISFLAAFLPILTVGILRSVFKVAISCDILFVVSWTFISSTFWNTIVYYKTNSKFRDAIRQHFNFLCRKVRGNEKRYDITNGLVLSVKVIMLPTSFPDKTTSFVSGSDSGSALPVSCALTTIL